MKKCLHLTYQLEFYDYYCQKDYDCREGINIKATKFATHSIITCGSFALVYLSATEGEHTAYHRPQVS